MRAPLRLAFACAAACALAPGLARAQDADASLATGRQILRDNECNGACHAKIVAGAEPTTLFTRAIRRVNSPEELRRQVELCVSFLNAPIFPEDVDHVVHALDRDAYRFE